MSDISAKAVKELRDKTGAGFMECKRALSEASGDFDTAGDLLRKWGMATAAKKSARATSQGWIGSYVHSNGKIGVLVEVRCETDFVAKNEVFQEYLKDLSMHIAAFNPLALDSESLDEATVEKEREIYLGSEEVQQKPENVREKIVEGKIRKFYSEVCLLEQAWVKDDKRTVREVLTEKISTIGENMSIARFVRLELGREG